MVGSGPGLAVIVTFIVHIIEIDALLVPRGHSGLWQVGSGYRIHAPLVIMDPGGIALDQCFRFTVDTPLKHFVPTPVSSGVRTFQHLVRHR